VSWSPRKVIQTSGVAKRPAAAFSETRGMHELHGTTSDRKVVASSSGPRESARIRCGVPVLVVSSLSGRVPRKKRVDAVNELTPTASLPMIAELSPYALMLPVALNVCPDPPAWPMPR